MPLKNPVLPTRFAAAVERGDPVTAKRLLKQGADVDTKCPNPKDLRTSWPALLRACYLGHSEVVDVLLQAGARHDMRTRNDLQRHETPTYDGDLSTCTPLYIAAARHHYHGRGREIVRLLLAHDADPNAFSKQGFSPLMVATEKGGGQVKVNSHLNFTSGFHSEDVDAPRFDPRREIGMSKDPVEALENSRNIVDLLLESGADSTRRDCNGWTALLLGAFLGQTIEVAHILEWALFDQHNEKTDHLVVKSTNRKAFTSMEETPAVLTERKKSRSQQKCEWIQLQRSKEWMVGMEIPTIISHRDSYGRSALMLAAHQRHPSCVRLLLEYGANPDDSVRATGWTSIMFALRSGAADSCKMLIAAGASLGYEPHPIDASAPLVSAKETIMSSDVHSKMRDKDDDSRDRRLFPRDEQTGWTPVMISAHNCIGSSHAACLKLLLESQPHTIDPELWRRADPVAFPKEVRTAEDLAIARGNSAALRLLGDAKKRWCEANNQSEKVGSYGVPAASTIEETEEQKHLARAEKDRARRRLERAARRRDREDEKAMQLIRKTRFKKKEMQPLSDAKDVSADRGTLNKVTANITLSMDNGRDLEVKLHKAQAEIARLRESLQYQQKETHRWRRVCRSREDEIAELRSNFEEQRSILIKKIKTVSASKA